MKHEAFSEILAIGETVDVEFKRCGQQPERDTFESVCSFANIFGGSIFLGVEDDGAVLGLRPDGLLAIKRNVVNVVNNPKLFDSPVSFEFERIDFEGKVVLRLWVPPSPNMHRFKGDIYERIEYFDVVVRSVSCLAEICIRKQGLYTELVEGTVFTAMVSVYRPSGAPPAETSEARSAGGVVAEIAGLVATRGSLTVSEAVEAGYPRRTAQRALAKLVDERKVVPVGNGRSRKYLPA